MCVCLKEGGDRGKLEVFRLKPGPDQVSFTASVTAVTDRELELTLLVKQGRVTPLFWFELPPFVKRKTQSFPHFRVKKPRVFTKPAS